MYNLQNAYRCDVEEQRSELKKIFMHEIFEVYKLMKVLTYFSSGSKCKSGMYFYVKLWCSALSLVN